MRFLEKVVQDIVKKDYNLSKISFIFPSRRAGLFFKKILRENKKIKKPLLSPDIFSIREFIGEISDYKILDHVPLLFSLYKTYQKVYEVSKSFDEFYHWGNIILKDFDDIDKYLIKHEELFRNLTEISDLNEYFQIDSQNQILNNFRELSQKIQKMYIKFSKKLKEERKSYYGLSIRDIAENFDKYYNHFNRWEKIIFVGFNILSRGEKKLIKELKKIDLVDLYWDIDHYFYSDTNQEAGYFFRKNKFIGKNAKWIENQLNNNEINIKIHGCSKKISQSKYLGNLLKRQKSLNNKTAIILPEESLLFPVLNSLPDNLKNVNVTMGYPLKITNVYNLFENITDMFINLKSLESRKGIYYKDVENILTHPYIETTLDKDAKYFLKELKKNKITYVSRDKISDYFNGEIDYIFEEVDNSEEFIDYLLNLMNNIRKKFMDHKKYELELEFIYNFYSLLKRLKELIFEYEIDIQISSLWKLLKVIIKNQKIPFLGEPLKGLQIMGLLETRALDFEKIYILSANEGVLPSSKSINSVIPFELRESLGLPTYRNNDSVFAYYFYRLLKNPDEVHIFYNTETDEFGKGEKSRFIEQLMMELKKRNNKAKIEEDIITVKSKTEKKQIIEIEKSDKIINKLYNLNYSASALNTFIQCSLKFYFNYVVGLREEDEFLDTIDGKLFGNIIHDAMDELYEKFKNEKVNDEIIDKIMKEVNSQIEKSYKKIMGVKILTEGKNYIYSEIIKNLIKKFIKTEEHGFEVKATEKRYEESFKYNGMDITIKGFIDRVDAKDEILRIVDYKTGRINSLKFDYEKEYEKEELLNKLKKRKEVLQLLFYFYLFKEDSIYKKFDRIKVGLFSFRALNDGFKPLKNNKEYLRKENIKDVKRILKIIFDSIFDRKKPFTQTSDLKICEYCEFKDMCIR